MFVLLEFKCVFRFVSEKRGNKLKINPLLKQKKQVSILFFQSNQMSFPFKNIPLELL
jgi:hypothetical protein